MDEVWASMSPYIPFGGEFTRKTTVELLADNRAAKDAKIHFTLDGTEQL